MLWHSTCRKNLEIIVLTRFISSTIDLHSNCYNTVVLPSTSSGASSVEFVQEPSSDEETDDDSVVKKLVQKGKKVKKKGKNKYN